MANNSPIEWTDATWTPIRARVREDAADIARAKGYTSLIQIAEKMAGRVGPHCEKVSPECDGCYSEAGGKRCLPSNGTGMPFDRRVRDLVDIHLDENILMQPLHWKKPRKIFPCSQTDLFAEFVPDWMIDQMHAVMGLCEQHTFQVLTKRAARLPKYYAARLGAGHRGDVINDLMRNWNHLPRGCAFPRYCEWPLPNVWLGISAGDQQRADERIPHLLQTPAAVRFLSLEPLLGPINFRWSKWDDGSPHARRAQQLPDVRRDGRLLAGCRGHLDGLRMLDWVIAGGESGPGARPMHPDWVRGIRDQCQQAGVPFFFKQWGAHQTFYDREKEDPDWRRIPKLRSRERFLNLAGGHGFHGDRLVAVRCLPKKKAGRELDGRTWDEMPTLKQAAHA